MWDVDGTLSNSFMLGFLSTLDVLKSNDLQPITEETYHQGTKYTTPARMAWHATGDPNHSIGIQLGQQFDDLYISKVSLDTAPFYPGIKPMLVDIARRYNLKYAAISNANNEYVTSVLNVNGVADLFDITIGADLVSAGKPHPEGLLRCSQHLNVPTSRCIYVGDAPTDGQAASAAGMTSIGVTWGSYSIEQVEDHFTHIVSSVDELTAKLYELLDQ